MILKFGAIFDVFNNNLSDPQSLIPEALKKFLNFPMGLSGKNLWGVAKFNKAVAAAAQDLQDVRLRIFNDFAEVDESGNKTIAPGSDNFSKYINGLVEAADETVTLPDLCIPFEVFGAAVDAAEEKAKADGKDPDMRFSNTDVIYLANIGILAEPVD
jgi:hypothetical protein